MGDGYSRGLLPWMAGGRQTPRKQPKVKKPEEKPKPGIEALGDGMVMVRLNIGFTNTLRDMRGGKQITGKMLQKISDAVHKTITEVLGSEDLFGCWKADFKIRRANRKEEGELVQFWIEKDKAGDKPRDL